MHTVEEQHREHLDRVLEYINAPDAHPVLILTGPDHAQAVTLVHEAAATDGRAVTVVNWIDDPQTLYERFDGVRAAAPATGIVILRCHDSLQCMPEVPLRLKWILNRRMEDLTLEQQLVVLISERPEPCPWPALDVTMHTPQYMTREDVEDRLIERDGRGMLVDILLTRLAGDDVTAVVERVLGDIDIDPAWTVMADG